HADVDGAERGVRRADPERDPGRPGRRGPRRPRPMTSEGPNPPPGLFRSKPGRLRSRDTASMVTRDGIRLDADIYRPDDPGPFPVLFRRQPYGWSIASNVTSAHPSWYAGHGYIVGVQDVRGGGKSEGEFDLLVHEGDDGFDAIQWAAALPDSTGAV